MALLGVQAACSAVLVAQRRAAVCPSVCLSRSRRLCLSSPPVTPLFFLTLCTFQMPPPLQIPPEIACGCQAQVLLAEESEVGPAGGPHPRPHAPHTHRAVGGSLGPASAWCHLAPSLPGPI